MISQPSLTHGLSEELGRAIIAGDYVDGHLPNETQIVSAFGVSRTVVREAVKILVGKGLVRTRPYAGTVAEPQAAWNLLDRDVLRWLAMRPFDRTLLIALVEARLGIEPIAAAIAATRATAQDHAAIFTALAQIGTATGDTSAEAKTEAAFHVAVITASKNPFLASQSPVIETAIQLAAHSVALRNTAPLVATWRTSLASAIVAGEAANARSAMEDLLRRTLGALEE